MLRTIGNIIDAVLVRGNVTTTAAGLYTDTILNGWVNDAHRWAAGFARWPFTEGRYSTTFTGTEETQYPEGWRTDSIRYLEIGGERLKKVIFQDYKSYIEDTDSAGQDKIYSDYGRTLFVNVASDVSGTMTVYGNYIPAKIDTTDPTLLTIFSDADEDGNEAIVEEMLSYAKLREKKFDEANLHHQRAINVLNVIRERIAGEQFGYGSHESSMWNRIKV
jgi:hypothetical protein